MTILNKSAWWLPKWIDKAMPDIDVEGTKLENKKLQAK
jgi:RND superfamily putative drug exporter